MSMFYFEETRICFERVAADMFRCCPPGEHTHLIRSWGEEIGTLKGKPPMTWNVLAEGTTTIKLYMNRCETITDTVDVLPRTHHYAQYEGYADVRVSREKEIN